MWKDHPVVGIVMVDFYQAMCDCNNLLPLHFLLVYLFLTYIYINWWWWASSQGTHSLSMKNTPEDVSGCDSLCAFILSWTSLSEAITSISPNSPRNHWGSSHWRSTYLLSPYLWSENHKWPGRSSWQRLLSWQVDV